MCEMLQANLDLFIFQETKLTCGVSVPNTDTPRRHHIRVVVFYQPSPRYAVEAIQQLRSNTVGFQLATGERRWYIIRCYLAHNDTSTIESVVAALKERPGDQRCWWQGTSMPT